MPVNFTLTGLRGLLALSVVIFHIYGSAVIEGYINEVPRENFLYLINYAGPISVNLFFVISGYLITQSLLNKRTLREFIINRVLRIYPVFLAIHLIIFTVGPFIGYKWMDGIGVSDYIIHFISNVLLLPGMFPFPIAQIVAWSLSYELFFYMIAGLAWFVYRSPRVHKLGRYIIYALMIAFCMVIVYYRKDMLFFVVGAAVYFSEDILRRIWRPLRVFYFNGIILLMGIYLFYHTMDNPIAAVLVLSFLFFIPIIMEFGLLSLFLRTRLMLYLGKVSFSLYMWHTMIMFPLKIFIPKISNLVGSSLSFALYALLSLVLSVVVSHLSYQYIEVRFTKHLKTRWTRKPVTNSYDLEMLAKRG